MKLAQYLRNYQRDKAIHSQVAQRPTALVPQHKAVDVRTPVGVTNLQAPTDSWRQSWKFKFEPLPDNSSSVSNFLSTCTLEELFDNRTQEVSINGRLVTETVRSLTLVDLRATIVAARWLVTLSDADSKFIESKWRDWQHVEGKDNLRALLSYCYYKPEDIWLTIIFAALARDLGHQILRQSKKSNKPAHPVERHSIYDGDTNNIGFMARDGGAFGSSCLQDNYGDEATGQERRFYDD
ncbi:hypothetical protein EON83_08020 [bacterium]|nr:MAG: hypothetical protein EON83_08020 [bacterium]